MNILLKIGEGYLVVSAIASVLCVIIGMHRRDNGRRPIANHRSGLIAGKWRNGNG
jgi:hypothetical protein